MGGVYRIPVRWSFEPGQMAGRLLPAFDDLASRTSRNRSVRRDLARLMAARIEAEIASEEARLTDADPVASARAIVAARRN